MKGATQCARRLKQLIRSLRAKLGKPGRPPAGDAVTQMILGIFSRDLPESKARDVLDRLRGMVVDYNELRVIPTIELIDMVGDVPDVRRKCEDLSRSLNSIFAVEHDVSLERLRELPRKEVIAYLDKIDGLDPYVRARIRLYGLQQHAIPLDEAMWAYARKTEIVHPRCPLEEAQAFLERRIPEPDALEVVGLLEKQAWVEMGGLVRRGEVEKIASVPPDRTTRHMLRTVASGGSISPATAEPKPAPEPAKAPAATDTKATPARKAPAAKTTTKTTTTRAAADKKKASGGAGKKQAASDKPAGPRKKTAAGKKTDSGKQPKPAAKKPRAGKSSATERATKKTSAARSAAKKPAAKKAGAKRSTAQKPAARKSQAESAARKSQAEPAAGKSRTRTAAARKPRASAGAGSKSDSSRRSGSGKAARGKTSSAASSSSGRRSSKARSA